MREEKKIKEFSLLRSTFTRSTLARSILHALHSPTHTHTHTHTHTVPLCNTHHGHVLHERTWLGGGTGKQEREKLKEFSLLRSTFTISTLARSILHALHSPTNTHTMHIAHITHNTHTVPICHTHHGHVLHERTRLGGGIGKVEKK